VIERSFFGVRFFLWKGICCDEFSGISNWNGVTLTVPLSIEEIGARCFYECRFLSKVVFESGSKLKEIGDRLSIVLVLNQSEFQIMLKELGISAFLNASFLGKLYLTRDPIWNKLGDELSNGPMLKK
jgi:hypothetical protein